MKEPFISGRENADKRRGSGFEIRSSFSFFLHRGAGAVTGIPAVAENFPRSALSDRAAIRVENSPDCSSGNPRPRPRGWRGVGLPGARIEAFSGHPAVAVQRPQSHLSERRQARVMTLQRSETMQGRKNSSEREGSPLLRVGFSARNAGLLKKE